MHYRPPRTPNGQPLKLEGPGLRCEPAGPEWHGLPIEVCHIDGPHDIGPCVAAAPALALCIVGSGHNDLRSGRRSVRLPFRRGVLIVQEQGFEMDQSQSRAVAATEIVSVQVPPEAVAALMPDECASWNLRTVTIEDDALAALVMAMRDELGRGCSAGRLFAQGLSMALVGYLRSRYAQVVSARRPQGKLSQRDLVRVVDFIAEHLARDIGIEELASLVRLGPSQFSRVFKATTGSSPYAFLQARRIERALVLMRGRDGLADIAQSVGLASQSHFTQVFRKVTGTTPARARALL